VKRAASSLGRSLAGFGRGGQQVALAGLFVLEVAVFSILGTRFMTRDNGFEILRLSVELGLLAVALTPVIVSGGIDLSVGSLMGLAAVVFGKLWRDGLSVSLGDLAFTTGPWPVAAAALATLSVGAFAGTLNGVLITRLRIPPLIVTLGSFSLFRGLAEGLTRGVDNYTRFPESFTFLGQGYLTGGIPAQLPIFVVAALGYWLLLHFTTVGRALFAIGFSPEGARYAGIPVERRLRLAYLLSGLMASLAAIIYVAHLGQAKADAGTGYELAAITAVVLGGTSIFGGRGTIHGTLLGLFTIAVLQNGLRLADLPAELAGILTGTLLLASIILDKILTRSITIARPALSSASEAFTVKNSQVAVLAGVILLAAIIVAASNWLLIRTLQKVGPGTTGSAGATPAKPITIAMMPKSKGNAYFIACRQGAEEAAKELGVNLIWDGPTDPDPAKQNEVIDTWITRGVDVIAVAVENREAISTVLRKARERGILVITWDSDAQPDARSFFVNQATPEGIGEALMDNAARILHNKGDFAIITASLTAANMIEWQKQIEIRRKAKYPDVKMVDLRPCDDLQKKAFEEATTIMNAHPSVTLIMAICSPAVPGAAEAVKQAGRSDVKVIGLGLPNDNKKYVHEGITDTVILWNTMDLGYLTVHTAQALKTGRLKAGADSFKAGRLEVEIKGDNVLLGKPFPFNKDNIDRFDF
jgi:rhamnose transport system permease protein